MDIGHEIPAQAQAGRARAKATRSARTELADLHAIRGPDTKDAENITLTWPRGRTRQAHVMLQASAARTATETTSDPWSVIHKSGSCAPLSACPHPPHYDDEEERTIHRRGGPAFGHRPSLLLA